MLAIIDYGVGNLFSLKSSIEAIGTENVITSDPSVIKNADHIILPGVGAFGDAMDKLRSTGLDKTVIEAAASGIPLLGICVGMQMLFTKDFEYGEHDGLDLISGEVRDIREIISSELKVPEIGWNSLHITKQESKLFDGIKDGAYVYFVHSYSALKCDKDISALTDYSVPITAAVESANVYGTQFHPEKSGAVGLRILENFCHIK